MKASLLVFVFSLIARAAAPSTTLANFPNSMIYAVQTDAAGNLYVAGFQGNFDKANPFVAKPSSTGQTLYSTTFAGSDFGIAWAIAVDSSGAVYVFGNTNSPDFPVTPGALQTTMQGSFQGFVSKLDPNGKIVYSTFIGGATDVTPGLTSAPGLDSILVDAAGDAIITGEAGTNDMIGVFPPAPAPVLSSSESFVLKLDPTGSKILAGIAGIGGMIAVDSQGNIYVAGLQYGDEPTPIPVTPGAFQSEPSTNACSLPGTFATFTISLNGTPNPLLYVGGEQINFQAPFEIAGATSASVDFASSLHGISDSLTLPIVASNPGAFLNPPVPPPSVQPCVFESSASINATFPLALNSDASINACLNPTPAGSVVTLFLDGLGVTSPAQTTGAITSSPSPALISPVITVSAGVTVVSVTALAGSVSGVWQVNLQIPANASSGGALVSLSAGSVPVRDANPIVWVK